MVWNVPTSAECLVFEPLIIFVYESCLEPFASQIQKLFPLKCRGAETQNESCALSEHMEDIACFGVKHVDIVPPAILHVRSIIALWRIAVMALPVALSLFRMQMRPTNWML